MKNETNETNETNESSKAAQALAKLSHQNPPSPARKQAARENGKKGGRPVTLKGGRAGFVRAINEAFRSPAANPTIRYSHSRGFHVESGIHPADSDVLWTTAANYILPTGRRSVRPTDYSEVRADILRTACTA